MLDDPALKAKASRYIDIIVIATQRPTAGSPLIPLDAAAKRYDLWSILLANKVLVQYHEATGDERVLASRCSATCKAMAARPRPHAPLRLGPLRWFEGLIPVYYAYERTGEAWLLDLARKLHAQGFDYEAFYAGEDVTVPRRAAASGGGTSTSSTPAWP